MSSITLICDRSKVTSSNHIINNRHIIYKKSHTIAAFLTPYWDYEKKHLNMKGFNLLSDLVLNRSATVGGYTNEK